jgi:hypothetical protein
LRTSTKTIFGLLLAALLIAPGCGSSTAPKDPGTPADTTSTVLLTVTTEADSGYIPGPVFIYVGTASVPTIPRSRMGDYIDENAPIVNPFGEHTATSQVRVPKGKQITLFAVEVGRSGANGRAPATKFGPPLKKTPDPTATEFSTWEAVGSVLTNDAQPEEGSVTMTLQQDRHLIAHFKPYHGVVLRYIGCATFHYEWNGPAYPSFGPGIPNQGVSPSYNSLSQDEQDYIFVYARKGTTVTFKPEQVDGRDPQGKAAQTGWYEWGGDAAGCGKDCPVGVLIAGSLQSTAIMRCSYVFDTNVPALPGCGGCTSQEAGGCNDFISRMRPFR